MNKKIIITGGAGFIGSHLSELLVKKKYDVTIIDNLTNGSLKNISQFKNKIEFIKGDIRDKKLIKKLFKRRVDVVYHLAALADIVPSIEKPELYYDVNVTGTNNLLEHCKHKKNIKFIYAASSSCYGIPTKYPTPENSTIKPEYPYALTKFLGEQMVMHYSKVYKFKASSLRLFNVYGTRSRTSGAYGAVFGVFLKQKISGKPLTVVGNGKQKRDFTFVIDVVNAFYKLIKKGDGNILNVGSGKSYSINLIVKLLGGKKINIPKRPGEPNQTFADINKIKKILNWKPSYSLEKGIKILIKNIDYWKEAPLWTPKKIKKATKAWFKYLAK
jgi:UDP-glucose 4-epimerase